MPASGKKSRCINQSTRQAGPIKVGASSVLRRLLSKTCEKVGKIVQGTDWRFRFSWSRQ